jgi:phospholipid/cholesterol/gamma-HCH transport system substrate-binding protein
MQKRAPTPANLIVIALFVLSCFGLLLFMWETFGGSVPLKSKGYRFEATFPRTLALAEQSEVEISGVKIGRVISLKSDSEGTTHVVAEVESQYAPLRRGDRLEIRQKTILGETYLEVIPNRDPPSSALPNESTIPKTSVEPFVTLDGLLETFSPKVRNAFRAWMVSMAEGFEGRGEQINAGFAELQPFVEDARKLLATLEPQSEALSTVVRETGKVFDSLTEREHQLEQLIVQGERTFGAAAGASRQFAEAFRELPGFERGSEKTLESLDRLSNAANPLLVQLRPAERALTPLVHEIDSFAPPFDGLLTSFGPLTKAAKRGLPALSKSLDLTTPLLKGLPPVLHNFDPFLQYTDEYLPELQSFFGNFTAATQAHLKSANSLHAKPLLRYLRSMQYIGPESLAVQTHRSGNNRANAYPHPGVFSSLASGLKVFDPSNCSDSAPSVEDRSNEYVTQELIEELVANKVVNSPTSSSNSVAAPSCTKQEPFTFNGKTSEFPHVVEAE